ncbi:hypothetical protein [Thalassobacillus hwangdonensis]|uniref:Uncharacterized protein n=1 Tax=Thalassobacillus hwangdonensis TaxID=546108 RepID=A0ABW3L340_9BACI
MKPIEHILQANENTYGEMFELIKTTREGIQKNIEENWDKMSQEERQLYHQHQMELIALSMELDEANKAFYERLAGESSQPSEPAVEKPKVYAEDGEDISDYFENDHLDGTEFQ